MYEMKNCNIDEQSDCDFIDGRLSIIFHLQNTSFQDQF